MALSGSISTNKYTTQNHGNIGLVLSWTASQSIDNNQTTINWTLKSYGTMSSGYSVQAGPVTVKIGGKTVLSATSRFSMYGGGGYTRSGSLKITHNQDGTKSVAMSVRAAIYSASVNCTASKTFTLNKIDRYAQLTGGPDFFDISNPTIAYTNTLGAPTVTDIKVRVEWNNGANFTNWVSLSDEGGTQALDLSAYKTAMLQACASSNSLPIVYNLQSTMNGTEYHSTKEAEMIVVPDAPTAGTVSFYDSNPTSSGITGDASIIVQSQSTLHIETTAATPKKEATIAAVVVSFNGEAYDITGDLYVDIVKPNYSGTFALEITYTDTRGNSSTATANVTITAWIPPSAVITLERVNGFETNTTLTVDGTISTVTGSTMSITEDHKESGGAWVGPSSVPDNTAVTLSLLNTKEWEVLVSVWDSFTVGSPTTYTLKVSKGVPIMFIDTDINAVALNGFPDAPNQLKVEDGEVVADGVTFPKVWSETEHKVGKWVDGSTVYEKTVILTSTVTAAAGNTSAAGAWTVLQTGWTENILPIEFFAWYEGGTDKTLWTHLTVQREAANNRLRVLNVRSTAATIDGFTIRYIKL